jgi:hypothetical protein
MVKKTHEGSPRVRKRLPNGRRGWEVLRKQEVFASSFGTVGKIKKRNASNWHYIT